MKPLECIDLGCSGEGNGRCKVFWVCLIRIGWWIRSLALPLIITAVFLMTVVGVCVLAIGGHGSPESMTTCGVLVSIAFTACTAIYSAYSKMAVDTVKEKVEAKNSKIDGIDKKLDPIGVDVKAARVAAKVGVQQNIGLDATLSKIQTDVNGGKEKEKREAYEQGRADQAAKQDSKF